MSQTPLKNASLEKMLEDGTIADLGIKYAVVEDDAEETTAA